LDGAGAESKVEVDVDVDADPDGDEDVDVDPVVAAFADVNFVSAVVVASDAMRIHLELLPSCASTTPVAIRSPHSKNVHACRNLSAVAASRLDTQARAQPPRFVGGSQMCKADHTTRMTVPAALDIFCR
jgi:hypothetical protein